MTVTLTHNYLVLPANPLCSLKTRLISEGGELIYDAEILLDGVVPKEYTHLGVSRFIGRTVTVSFGPEIGLPVSQTYTPPEANAFLCPRAFCGAANRLWRFL